MFRFALLVAPFILVGCSTDTALAPAKAHTVSATGDQIDLYFNPVDLVEGEAISAEVGSLRLESIARKGEHHVSLKSDGRPVQAVTGLLDGEVQLSADPSSDGGQTSIGPTSVHRAIACDSTGCVEVVEYDYDLHGDDGDGTANWRTPDGRSATIDRLRYELDAAPGQTASRVQVTAPEPVHLVSTPAAAQQ